MHTNREGIQKQFQSIFSDLQPSLPGIGDKKSETIEKNGNKLIKNYQVILERRSPDAVQKQVILERKEMPIAYWGSGELANIRLVGDLDGDAQPDFIFESYLMEGFEASLYLSSEADKGSLVKLVRKIFGACC